MSRTSKSWAAIAKVLTAAGAEGATYNQVVKASKLNPNSISSQLSTRWHSGELNILNEDWKEQPKRYVLPEFGGTPYIAFKEVADAAREGAALSNGTPNLPAVIPKKQRSRGRVSVAINVKIGNKMYQIDIEEAIAIHRDLTNVLARFGRKQ